MVSLAWLSHIKIPQHLTQNAFAALAGQEHTPQLSSAQDIEMLLCNIGANCRVSSVTIQSLMQGASTPAETEKSERCALTGNEIIDLIAMIRSI
eukprot:scaffold239141_cov48-Cyclotella_meneghiniana.AAC.2